jgi:hypothetical protein
MARVSGKKLWEAFWYEIDPASSDHAFFSSQLFFSKSMTDLNPSSWDVDGAVMTVPLSRRPSLAHGDESI